MIHSVLHSTELIYIQHYQSLFEGLWKNGIDVQERIRQVEMGLSHQTTDIIRDSNDAKKLLLRLLKNAREEILIIYPSSKAVDLQKKIGVMNILYKKSQQGLKVRILSPTNINLDQLILPNHIDSKYHLAENTVIREILKQQDFKPTIFMIDREYILALELKNILIDNFENATGLATYSTSNPTVMSYISIFSSLWEQTEMSISLRMANEKLVQAEHMRENLSIQQHMN